MRSKFEWGIDVDDMWRFAGIGTPRSIVIPFVLSVKSRTDRFFLPSHAGGIPRARARESSPWGEVPLPEQQGHVTLRRAEDLASLLKKGNFDFVRCWFPWNFFEKKSPPASSHGKHEEREYIFPLDPFVSKLVEAGIGIVGVIGAGYSRFLPQKLGTNKLEEYTSRLVESSTAIVRHYKDRVDAWQIENEPNWWRAHYSMRWRRGQIWHGLTNQQVILGALHTVVREEAPKASIIVNLEADNMLSKNTKWGFYAKYCDTLGLDFYPGYMHPSFIDATDLCETARNVRKETGLRIMITETGYPSGPRLLGYSEERQAIYVRKASEAVYSCDSISGLGWFRFSDSYWKSFPFHENYFGLLSRRGRQKPAWIEYLRQIGEAKRGS